MSVPEDWVHIPGGFSADERHGADRWAEVERRKLKPNGHGTQDMHVRGDDAELAFAAYRGVIKPADWTLEGDRGRGHDVDGFQVRSAKRPDDPMSVFMRDYERHLDGVLAFVLTHNAPNAYYVVGWITVRKSLMVGMRGKTRAGEPVTCWYCDQKWLTPFPPIWQQAA